jgi:hypothetical protein
METNHESKGPAVLFLGAWWILSDYAPLAEHAFITAIALMVILWLAVKFAGRVVFRLGRDGWFLIAQVAVWFGLFLWFVPAGAITKILLLWGLGIPLIFVGAGARALGHASPKILTVLESGLRYGLPVLCIVTALVASAQGYGFLPGLFGALVVCALSAIPLYYGWRAGEPCPCGERDARFGSEEDYRKAGVSDDF